MFGPSLRYRVDERASVDGAENLELATDAGSIRCRLHAAPEGNAGIVWVFGAGGGWGGPAGGIYERLARVLQPEGITSLQVAYRQPANMRPCVEDTLTGAAFLESRGSHRVALVGHSFGGAVVINAGSLDRHVIAVAALSSQSHRVEGLRRLSPRPLLLAHGEDDEVLPASCSITMFEAAKDPKQLILYPGCRHGLDQCRDELDRDLSNWLLRIFELG